MNTYQFFKNPPNSIRDWKKDQNDEDNERIPTDNNSIIPKNSHLTSKYDFKMISLKKRKCDTLIKSKCYLFIAIIILVILLYLIK